MPSETNGVTMLDSSQTSVTTGTMMKSPSIAKRLEIALLICCMPWNFGILRMAFVLPELPIWSLELEFFSGPAEGQWGLVGFQVSDLTAELRLRNWHK